MDADVVADDAEDCIYFVDTEVADDVQAVDSDLVFVSALLVLM